ncbi:Galactose-1-phosphate uridylyltransferase [Pseudoneobacillus rhizosphaerae]|uniref:Galactose-1-phosphate uridylyltransferase n=2 Tax=Pseudoneobacillus rhizosphaerae TaxID=2880968 RepID=A0A9C7G943_9BACI|nr:Galactose-1-phosphate uridylyltransferase [Pseudoneobacillus rhizosphaerae]
MMIFQLIQQLIHQAISVQLIERDDQIYVRNQLMSLWQLNEFREVDQIDKRELSIQDILDLMVQYACEKGIIEDIFDLKEMLSSKIMNCFVARPSTVNRIFYEKYQQSPDLATRYFYELSQNSNYIQMKRIRKNMDFQVTTEYGELDITINLSKPEKDPKSIELERAATTKKSDYPMCLLCAENEGYDGRIGHPARANHRMIRLNLVEENWLLQYSPYVYYNEHCIVLSEKHTDMKISKRTFMRLLTFVKKFPHYFLGSNADIPIVGGSILSHDHYQGGHFEFAMERAEVDWTFEMKGFTDVQCSVVKWPMSVIRIQSEQISSLVEAATHVLETWKKYSDEAVGIFAKTNQTPHNTITPIARKKGERFELDLVLRNNRTSEEHPLGIFHPHSDVHHIKKENIGLIEVMGLAVLPARLKQELAQVESFILGEENNVGEYHNDWANMLKEKYQRKANSTNIEELVRMEVGKKFLKGLEDAGVYKRSEEGMAGFKRFIATLS